MMKIRGIYLLPLKTVNVERIRIKKGFLEEKKTVVALSRENTAHCPFLLLPEYDTIMQTHYYALQKSRTTCGFILKQVILS